MVIATVIITTATTTGYKSDNNSVTTVTVKFLSLALLACPDPTPSLQFPDPQMV